MDISRDLTTGSINRHIAALAIPAAIGFLFNTLYNLFDTLFAGTISTEAQSALGFAFPIFFLLIAGSVGLGQGTTTLVSNALGAGDRKLARRYAGQSFILGFLLAVLIIVFVALEGTAIFRGMGAEGETLRLTQIYTFIIVASAFAFVYIGAMNGVLSALGDLRTFGNALFRGTVLNLVYNAVFVYLFGWGMFGIAFATFLAQYIVAGYVFLRLRKVDLYREFEGQDFRPDATLMKDLLHHSVPATLNMVMIAVGFFVMTAFFARFGDTAVAASNIANRLLQLFLLPTIGINMAVLAIAGQNFGAGMFARVRLLYKRAIQLSLLVAVPGGVVLWLFGTQMMAWFSGDGMVIDTGSLYLKCMAVGLPALVLVLMPLSLLQAIRCPLIGPVINLFRLVVVPFVMISALLEWFNADIGGVFMGELAIFWIMGVITPIIAWWVMKRDLAS